MADVRWQRIRDELEALSVWIASYKCECITGEHPCERCCQMNNVIDDLGVIDELMAREDRYNLALQRIRDWRPGISYTGAIFDAQTIAREALE